MGARGSVVRQPCCIMMGRTACLVLGLAVLVTITSGTEESDAVENAVRAKLMTMDKAMLANMLLKTHKSAATQSALFAAKLNRFKEAQSTSKAELDASRQQVIELNSRLMTGNRGNKFNEKNREIDERKSKAAIKKKADAKKKAKLQRKEKLSDILMDHGAAYLAMKAAKKYARKGSNVQKKQTMKAAIKG